MDLVKNFEREIKEEEIKWVKKRKGKGKEREIEIELNSEAEEFRRSELLGKYTTRILFR